MCRYCVHLLIKQYTTMYHLIWIEKALLTVVTGGENTSHLIFWLMPTCVDFSYVLRGPSNANFIICKDIHLITLSKISDIALAKDLLNILEMPNVLLVKDLCKCVLNVKCFR